MPVLVFYISAHGFGHASRDLEVVHALYAQRPDLRVILRTAVPRWFLEASARSPFEVQPADTDTGIVQVDSLTIDRDETMRRAGAFYATFEQRVRDEAAVLRDLGASVVVGDIPPLAFAAAHEAGLPSVAVANFTWDWIYDGYPQFAQQAPEVVETIREAYRHTALALRLPFHGGFEPMTSVTRDIPLIARRASRTRDDVRRLINLESTDRVVLASFGGHPFTLPYADIAASSTFTLLLTDFEQRRSGDTPPAGPPHGTSALRLLTSAQLVSLGIRYPDLVAASDVVIGKPGYGLVSECIANGVALLYMDRGYLRENEVFDRELPGALRCRHIPQADFVAGRWTESIDALLQQIDRPAPRPLDGADVAASAILETLAAAATDR